MFGKSVVCKRTGGNPVVDEYHFPLVLPMAIDGLCDPRLENFLALARIDEEHRAAGFGDLDPKWLIVQIPPRGQHHSLPFAGVAVVAAVGKADVVRVVIDWTCRSSSLLSPIISSLVAARF